jgi:hypothetical protein
MGAPIFSFTFQLYKRATMSAQAWHKTGRAKAVSVDLV